MCADHGPGTASPGEDEALSDLTVGTQSEEQLATLLLNISIVGAQLGLLKIF